MNDKIKHIIFDFDGTLADTSPVIIGTMLAAIKGLGLPTRTEEECRATIGLRLEEIPAILWPELSDISADFARTYRRIFDEKKKDLRAQAYPGVIEGLRRLHDSGFGMAVASSRSHKSLVEYLEYFTIAELFSCVVGGNDVENGKPSPEPVFAICRVTGYRPKDCLVVGDATFDIEMGRAAGCQTCGMTYGNQSRDELLTANPTFTADSFPELTARLISEDRGEQGCPARNEDDEMIQLGLDSCGD